MFFKYVISFKFVFYTVGIYAVVAFHNTAPLFLYCLSHALESLLGGDKRILSALRKQYLIHNRILSFTPTDFSSYSAGMIKVIPKAGAVILYPFRMQATPGSV